MDTPMITEKLQALEAKVKAAVALLVQLKDERAALQARVEELQNELHAQGERLGRVEAERDQVLTQLKQLQEEREEVRMRVEVLLEEIARIETSIPGQ